MNSVFAGAMITIMALCVFGAALPLGGVTPELAFPAYALTLLLVFLWGISLLKEVSWIRSPMHLPAVLFVLYATGRYFFAAVEYDARVELFQVWVCGLIYLCSASRFHRPADRSVFLVALLLLGVLESSYSIWQACTRSDMVFFWERPPTYAGRGSGTFIYPNQLASFLEIGLGLAAARTMLVRRESLVIERSVIVKVFTVYAAAMIIAGLISTRSRGGWLASAIGLLALVFLGDWRPRLTWRKFGLLASVLVAMALLVMNVDWVSDRFFNTFKTDHDRLSWDLGDRSLGGRTLMWKGTLEMIRDHPLFGTGPGSWQWIFQKYKKPDLALLTRPEYAHNDLLNLASDYGLVGFGLMAWLGVGFWRHARSLSRPEHSPETRAFAVGALVAVGAVLAHCCFDFVLHLPVNGMVFAAVLGMTAAMEDPARGFERQSLGRLPLRYGLAVAVLLVCAAGVWSFYPTALAYRATDLGNLLRKELEYDAALGYYETGRELDPKFPEPPARIGDVHRTWALYRVGPEKQAERRQLALKAAESYERSLRLNPYQSTVWSDRGRVLEMAGENAEAIKSFERAIEVYPSSGVPYFLLGCHYRDHGEPAKARELFLKADRIHATHTTGLNAYELEGQR